MNTPALPPDEATLLASLRRDLPVLRDRVRTLRAQGWTLHAIGTPLNAPRSTVRSWETHPVHHPSPAPLPPPPAPPNLRPSPPSSVLASVRALRPDVPASDAVRIRTLAPLARRVRGGTPSNSPYRRAKRELDDLVAHYAMRNVSTQRLADLAGVSYRAMKVRLSQRRTASAA